MSRVALCEKQPPMECKEPVQNSEIGLAAAQTQCMISHLVPHQSRFFLVNVQSLHKEWRTTPSTSGFVITIHRVPPPIVIESSVHIVSSPALSEMLSL